MKSEYLYTDRDLIGWARLFLIFRDSDFQELCVKIGIR